MTPTQNGNLMVMLMIAQNQNQMMMEQFHAFDDGLWLVISKKVSILLEYVF